MLTKLTTVLKYCFSLPPHSKIIMGAPSPTMTQGKIVKWNAKVGQKIQEGDVLFDLQTDKAVVPVEAKSTGYLANIIQKQKFKVGQIVGIIAQNKGDIKQFNNFNPQTTSKNVKQPEPTKKQAQHSNSIKSQQPQTISLKKSETKDKVIASPLAKKTANQLGVSLKKLEGTGPGGRIINLDVIQYSLASKQQKKIISKPQIKEVAQKPIAYHDSQNPYQQIPLTGMRKTIASRLTQSKTTIPHFYLQTSIKFSKLLNLRSKINEQQKNWGTKISVNDMVMYAIARAVRDVQGINYQWAGDRLKKFKYVDISMAVSLPSGLITPIIQKACSIGLTQISKKSKQLSTKARDGKLTPNQYTGGTISVSNVGMYGIDVVIPIINPPQSMIVGVGTTKKIVVMDSGNPKQQDICEMSVAVDHRVIDGALAAEWLSRLKKLIEQPAFLIM